MERLWLSILYLCLNFGEVRSLLDLADSLDMNYGKAWKRLRRLEALDRRLRVRRYGRGCPMQITYNVEGFPERLSMGGITVSRKMLYRESYDDTNGRPGDAERYLHPVGD